MAAAQNNSFTLEQCIDYALKNNFTAQNSAIDEKIAAARVKEIAGQGMPQVDGSFGITHNQKLPRFFAKYSNGGFLQFPDGPPSGLDYGEVVAAQNFFQLKSSGNAGLSINQLIFNGSYFVGLEAARSFRELAKKNKDQSQVAVIEQVTKAFYLALVNRERISLFNSNIGRIDTLLINTKALNKNGFAEDIDVDRLQVTYNNLVTEREKFLNLQVISLELLKFQMNYPMDSELTISGEIKSFNALTDVDSYRKEWDYSARPDFQALEVNKKLQELNVKNYKARSLPTIAAFANLGLTTQSPNIGGIFKTNSSFETSAGLGADKWYSFSQFGVQMNMPLFGGFQLKNKVQQEKLTLLKIENSMKQTKSGIDVEIKSSFATYQNAIKTMDSQKANMELSSKVAKVAKIKYEQGVGSNIEVLDAENTLKESQVNYYNALYDALVAKVNLDKAYGKLLPESK